MFHSLLSFSSSVACTNDCATATFAESSHASSAPSASLSPPPRKSVVGSARRYAAALAHRLGQVAVKSSVWRGDGSDERILSSCGLKPMSRRRSASSSVTVAHAARLIAPFSSRSTRRPASPRRAPAAATRASPSVRAAACRRTRPSCARRPTCRSARPRRSARRARASARGRDHRRRATRRGQVVEYGSAKASVCPSLPWRRRSGRGRRRARRATRAWISVVPRRTRRARDDGKEWRDVKVRSERRQRVAVAAREGGARRGEPRVPVAFFLCFARRLGRLLLEALPSLPSLGARRALGGALRHRRCATRHEDAALSGMSSRELGPPMAGRRAAGVLRRPRLQNALARHRQAHRARRRADAGAGAAARQVGPARGLPPLPVLLRRRPR